MQLQDYSKKPSIEGVKLIDLPHFYDDGGSFMEIARLIGGCGEENSKLYPAGNSPLSVTDLRFEELQINYSMLMPGTTKGFHIHKIQTDVWFIPPFQRMLIGLIDLRENKFVDNEDLIDTEIFLTDVMRFTMGIKPQLLVIPPMVAHLIKNIDTKPGHMIYLVDQFFNPQDEFRLPWGILGKDFVEVEKG